MLGRATLLVALLLAGSACAERKEPDPYEPTTVAAAEAGIEAWNGRTVAVRGWLTDPCTGDSCAIFPMPVKRGADWPKGSHLSIASETLVEPMLAANQGREVIVRGVLSSQCRRANVHCTDRAPDITPISLRLVSAGPGK